MKIVCIGDSLTYGFGVKRSKTWINLAKNKLDMEIINEGVNGDTSGGMVARFNNEVIVQKPDVVFIMGGSNDLIAGADLGVVKANIMAMAHQALGKLIAPIIGIAPKMDLENISEEWASFTDFNKISIEQDKYSLWIKRFCKTFNIGYIDFYSEIDKFIQSNNEKIHIDGLHLNEKGQEIMAEVFCNAINNFK